MACDIPASNNLKKSPTDITVSVRICRFKEEFQIMGSYYEHDNVGRGSGYEITLAHMKIKKSKKIENYILLGGIIIIGYLWIWMLAIWWLWTSRRVEEEFIRIWRNHPNFEARYPYQRMFYEMMTEDPLYQQKLYSKNSLKNLLMAILAIPFLGYILVLLATILTVGIIWIFYYMQMQQPNKYLRKNVGRPRTGMVSEFVPPVSGGKLKDAKEFAKVTHPPPIAGDSPPFYCQICGVKHKAGTPRMQCENCGCYVCIEAFAESAKVGRVVCPMCDGRLVPL